MKNVLKEMNTLKKETNLERCHVEADCLLIHAIRLLARKTKNESIASKIITSYYILAKRFDKNESQKPLKRGIPI